MTRCWPRSLRPPSRVPGTWSRSPSRNDELDAPSQHGSTRAGAIPRPFRFALLNWSHYLQRLDVHLSIVRDFPSCVYRVLLIFGAQLED